MRDVIIEETGGNAVSHSYKSYFYGQIVIIYYCTVNIINKFR